HGEIDVPVHSAKDVPLEEESELVIAAYPARADPRDALVTKSHAASLASLPANATVGTDSPRRAGFVRAARPDLRIVPLHGNVDTRPRRLDGGDVEALASIDGDRFTMIVGGVNSDGSDLRIESIEGDRSEAIAEAEAAGRRLAGAVALR